MFKYTQPNTPHPYSALAVMIAVYMLLLGVIITVAGGGILFGESINTTFNNIIADLDPDNPPPAPAPLPPDVARLFTALGLLNIGLGGGFVVSAVGVLLRRRWSRMMTQACHIIYLVMGVISVMLGGGMTVFSFILLAISGWIVYQFRTHHEIITSLNR